MCVNCSTLQLNFSAGYSRNWGRGWVSAVRSHQDNKSGRWSVRPGQAWTLQCEGKMIMESVWVEAILPCLPIQRWFLVNGVGRNKCCTCKTTPSAVNLESPWRNVRRDGCSYGSHAISNMISRLQVLSSSCHSEEEFPTVSAKFI